jgi:hypothetical protein
LAPNFFPLWWTRPRPPPRGDHFSSSQQISLAFGGRGYRPMLGLGAFFSIFAGMEERRRGSLNERLFRPPQVHVPSASQRPPGVTIFIFGSKFLSPLVDRATRPMLGLGAYPGGDHFSIFAGREERRRCSLNERLFRPPQVMCRQSPTIARRSAPG